MKTTLTRFIEIVNEEINRISNEENIEDRKRIEQAVLNELFTKFNIQFITK